MASNAQAGVSELSKRPKDTAFRQQRLPAYKPVLLPNVIILVFLVIGIIFTVLGSVLKQESDDLVELRAQYGGAGTKAEYSSCDIDHSNEGSECEITFNIKETIKPPVYLYYELTNFYQNHRKYVKSYSQDQLLGKVYSKTGDVPNCAPLKQNGSKVLNPCGLGPNSLFNDKIVLDSDTLQMKTTGISWPSDRKKKFLQPTGYKHHKVAFSDVQNCLDKQCPDSTCTNYLGQKKVPCMGYNCSDPDYYNCERGYYVYHYPKPDAQQFLYQTFPEVISPIVGVHSEHFIVWMRYSALPNFRKLYGRIEDKIEKGTQLKFKVTNNFHVKSFKGTKALVLGTSSWFGGKNTAVGVAFLVVGSVCIACAVALMFKQVIPGGKRKLGDVKLLK